MKYVRGYGRVLIGLLSLMQSACALKVTAPDVTITVTSSSGVTTSSSSSSGTSCAGAALTASPYSGSGTAADPYLICTAAQLDAIGQNSADWSKYFSLGADIDMSAYTGTMFHLIGDWGTAAPFSGTFDGQNHTVQNFTYSTGAAVNAAMFQYISGDISGDGVGDGEIKNLNLTNITVSSGLEADGLVYAAGSAKISGVHILGGAVSAPTAAGLVGGGLATLQVVNSSSAVAITVTTGSYVGGLVAQFQDSSASITGSSFTGSITCTGAGGTRIGGLIGELYGSISNSYSTANISCPNSGAYIGGLAGYAQGGSSIQTSYSMGNVNAGYRYVAGLVGYFVVIGGESITDSYSTGNISSTGNGGAANYIAGIVGSTGALTMARVGSTGAISGANYVGGVAGLTGAGTTTDCYAQGSVTASGGVGTYAGGIVGATTGTVTRCYYSGTASDPGGNQDGLTGSNGFGNVVGSYCLNSNTCPRGSTKTAAQLKAQATYGGWDFTTVWQINEGVSYPTLR